MAQLNDLIVTGSSRLLGNTNTGAITANGTVTPNGGVNFTSTGLPQFAGSPPFYLGIEAFNDGGQVKWQQASNCSVGYATSAGSAAPTSGSAYYIQNNVGSSRATTTSGSWISMLNATETGSPTLPTSSKWWTVLSADCWSSAPNNWMSQLAIATQETSGVWWRRNDNAGTSIDSSTWHRLAEGDSDGNAVNANKVNNLTVQTAVPANAVFTDHYAWSDITGKPITLAANSSALNTNGWKTLGGRSSGSKLTVSYASSSPATWNSGAYSATVLFGASDTKGFLDCSYDTPIVTFGGSSARNSNDNDPKWYWKFSGTSGKTYTLPNDSCTLGTSNLALGTTSTTALKGDTKYAGASSAGGSATSAVKLDTATAGSATQPCYFTGGQPTACTYSLNKTVPSNAEFTDTKVTQTPTTENYTYEVLLAGSRDGAWGSDTTKTEGVCKNEGLHYNPKLNWLEVRRNHETSTQDYSKTVIRPNEINLYSGARERISLSGIACYMYDNDSNITLSIAPASGNISTVGNINCDGTVSANSVTCNSMSVSDISSQYTFSKTGGHWTCQGIRAVRSGNVVTMQIIIKGGSSVSAGSNALTGTFSGGPLPARTNGGTQDIGVCGVQFYGVSALVGTLNSSGSFTLRLLINNQSLGSNTTSIGFTFVCD